MNHYTYYYYIKAHQTHSIKQRIIYRIQELLTTFLIFYFIALALTNYHQYRNSLSDVTPSFGNFSRAPVSVYLLVHLALVMMFIEIDFSGYKTAVLQTVNPDSTFHRLTEEEIFDNKNRQNIILAILNEPGIHYNKILKTCQLSPGQLQWHLKLLEEYHIIKTRRWGKYLMYFPFVTPDDYDMVCSHPVLKSKTTRKIFKEIKAHPGINPSKIAKKLDIPRNTIKYHTDKLIDHDFIHTQRKGRKLLLFECDAEPFDWYYA